MNLGVGSIISVGGGTGGGGASSGIQTINPGTNIGPTIEFQGANGVVVTSPSTNVILIDGAGASGVSGGTTASGLCFAADFTGITASTITHNLGTTNVVIDVFDASDNQMHPDAVSIIDINNISLAFNTPQTGKVVIVACGGNNTNLEEAKRYALLVS